MIKKCTLPMEAVEWLERVASKVNFDQVQQAPIGAGVCANCTESFRFLNDIYVASYAFSFRYAPTISSIFPNMRSRFKKGSATFKLVWKF